MKALIDPNQPVSNITSFVSVVEEGVTSYEPIREDIPNSQRICQIENTTFEVASPLYWIDCNNSINANTYYYDGSDSTIKEIVDATPPTE